MGFGAHSNDDNILCDGLLPNHVCHVAQALSRVWESVKSSFPPLPAHWEQSSGVCVWPLLSHSKSFRPVGWQLWIATFSLFLFLLALIRGTRTILVGMRTVSPLRCYLNWQILPRWTHICLRLCVCGYCWSAFAPRESPLSGGRGRRRQGHARGKLFKHLWPRICL